MRNVLFRIVAWATAGFLVSLGWAAYFAQTSKDVPINAAVSTLARLTQPSAALLLFIKPGLPLGLTWVALANAATYALLGLIVATIRQHHRPAHSSA